MSQLLTDEDLDRIEEVFGAFGLRSESGLKSLLGILDRGFAATLQRGHNPASTLSLYLKTMNEVGAIKGSIPLLQILKEVIGWHKHQVEAEVLEEMVAKIEAVVPDSREYNTFQPPLELPPSSMVPFQGREAELEQLVGLLRRRQDTAVFGQPVLARRLCRLKLSSKSLGGLKSRWPPAPSKMVSSFWICTRREPIRNSFGGN